MNIQEEYKAVGKPYQPIYPAESIHNLSRQETLDTLLEVEKIANNLEVCELEIPRLEKKIKAEQDIAEALRIRLSKRVSVKIWSITILGAVIGSFIIPVILTFALGAVAYFAAFKKFGMPYLDEHQEENNLAADAHIREQVLPLQTQLNEIKAIKEDIINNGKQAWALEVIGKDLLYSACINDLYGLVKSRRADSLKEALNKYDDEQYKARMKEIQEATQCAAEMSAKEAEEQTKQLRKIKRNTFWTWWNTR